jgi:hypothetical protein
MRFVFGLVWCVPRPLLLLGRSGALGSGRRVSVQGRLIVCVGYDGDVFLYTSVLVERGENVPLFVGHVFKCFLIEVTFVDLFEVSAVKEVKFYLC